MWGWLSCEWSLITLQINASAVLGNRTGSSTTCISKLTVLEVHLCNYLFITYRATLAKEYLALHYSFGRLSGLGTFLKVDRFGNNLCLFFFRGGGYSPLLPSVVKCHEIHLSRGIKLNDNIHLDNINIFH